MPPLKHPLLVFRAGGHWLRQATVLGLGVGLLAGTGLIATASAASAHPDAAGASSGHRPAQRCEVIVGRRHELRVRPRACLSPVPPALARCHIKLQPLRGRTAPPKAVRLGRPPRPGRLQVKVPAAVRLSACPPVQMIRPAQVKLCRDPRTQGAKSAARCCTLAAPRLRLVRPQRLGRAGPLQVKPGRLQAKPGRLQVKVPAAVRVSACPPLRVQLIRPAQVKLCQHGQAQRAKSAARCCAAAAPGLRLVRPQRLLRRGRVQAPVALRLRGPVAVRVPAPVRACVIVAPVRLRPAPRR
jgi:hypothetical protein